MKRVIFLNLVTGFCIVFLSCLISVGIAKKQIEKKVTSLQAECATRFLSNREEIANLTIEKFKQDSINNELKKRIQLLEGQMVLLFPRLLEKR